MLELKNVTKIYTFSNIMTYALKNVNLQMARGEFLMVKGPSGSGKSTLLNILGLLDTIDEGEYILNNMAIHHSKFREMSKIRNNNIGIIFQSFNLISDLNVVSNVELPLIYKNKKPKERKEKVEEILEKVGILHRRKHYPALLSGGERQRVAIARALVTDPVLLLADEPTGNLDTNIGIEIMELLRHLNEEGTTIVMVTHDLELTKYAQRCIQIRDGMIQNEAI